MNLKKPLTFELRKLSVTKLVLAGVFMLGGIVTIVLAQTSIPRIVFEAESGTLSSTAVTVTDATASGGQHILFNSQTSGCNVTGGTSGSPANLNSALGNTACTTFNLGDGFYQSTTINRAGITVRAQNKCQARVASNVKIQAQGVTLDGVSIDTRFRGIEIYSPGVRVQNNCVQGFGKTEYGDGIRAYQQALNPNDRIIVSGNSLTDWGGFQYSNGIGVGFPEDTNINPAVSIEFHDNIIIGVPNQTGFDIWGTGIQAFHPIIATGNYIENVNSNAFGMKTSNSLIKCNEMVGIKGDGAINNRYSSNNNVYEYNIIRDSYLGIVHYMGTNTQFRGNVIYNVPQIGRINNWGTTSNVTFENNTFYNSTSSGGFFWDTSSSGSVSNIMFRKNIFHTVSGSAISNNSSFDPLWDETENIFFRTIRPTGTTGAGGSSTTIDPLFVSPPSNFAAQAPGAAGKGAPWPLPCN